MVTRWGMSETLAPRTYGEHEEMIFLGKEIHSQRDYSEKIAEQIDAEVSLLIENGRKQAERILTERRAKLDAMVAELLKKETLERAEFEAIMKA
jgi:cell division protease FtsH